MRLLALLSLSLLCACGERQTPGVPGTSGALSTDAGRYAQLRADGGCYDTTAVSSLTLIDVFEGAQSCTVDTDCEVRPLGVTCVPSGCAISVTKNSCSTWKPRHTELERTLCFNLDPACPVVRVSCATPAPTRVFCDNGFCALAPRFTDDAGVPGCPSGGCESLTCP